MGLKEQPSWCCPSHSTVAGALLTHKKHVVLNPGLDEPGEQGSPSPAVRALSQGPPDACCDEDQLREHPQRHKPSL